MKQRNRTWSAAAAVLLACFLTACDLDVMTRFERWSLDPGVKAQISSIDETIASAQVLENLVDDPAALTRDQMRLELYYLLQLLEKASTDVVVSRRVLDHTPLQDLDYWFKRFEAEVKSLEDYYVLLTQISEQYRPLHTRVLHPDEVLLESEWTRQNPDPLFDGELSALPLTGFRYKDKVTSNNRRIRAYLGSRAKNLNPGLVARPRGDVVHTGVTEDGGTAYLRIDSFLIEGLAPDGTVLGIQDFLSDLGRYDHLIIDLRGNPGGLTGPWRSEILPRLVTEPTTITSFLAFRNTKFGETMRAELLSLLADGAGRAVYDRSRAGQSAIGSMIFRSTAKSPVGMTERQYEDKAYLGDYLRIEDRIEPRDPIGFKGQIYLLTDSQVLGSADTFSHYLRELDLVKMIGKPAKGDGVAQSFGIYRAVLPYSGLVYQIQTAYGFNANGSSNQERGTPVDFYIENGEELDFALTRIKQTDP